MTVKIIISPAVTWCMGYKNGLLMHLHKEKVQSVPLAVIQVIEHIDSTSSVAYQSILAHFDKHADTVKEYLDFLLYNSWLLEVPEFVEYRAIDIKPIPIRKIRNLYLEVNEHTELEWFESIAIFMREKRATYCLILKYFDFCEKTQVRVFGIIKVAKKLGFNQVGILIDEDHRDTTVFGRVARNVDFFLANSESFSQNEISNTVVKLLPPDIVHKGSHLQSSIYSSRHNRAFTYRSDNLFIDKKYHVFPHPFDLFHLGEANSITELKSALDGEKANLYVSMSKSKVDKCNICEYRLSCTNSLWNRENASILNSAPRNCTYDPENGVWHSHPVDNQEYGHANYD